jgi:RHS repeat-associated protein
MDGVGRPVITAKLDPATHDAVTWSTLSYDRLSSATAANYGNTLETLSLSALGHATRVRTDGLGRIIQRVDAENNIAFFVYDNAANPVRSRDANGVGLDCTYDPRSRRTACTDTQGDITTTTYNVESMVIDRTDAKSISLAADTVYDARGRVLESTSRLANDTTTSTYDPNGNLLTLTDAEGGITTYHYNARNLRIAEDWPGHNPSAAIGDSDYDRTELVYDAARRPLVKTDQLGDTVVFNYDLAGRLTQRDYRTYANSGDSNSDGIPDGTVADSDTFTYDGDSRLLSASSERYTNTVTLTYDEIGRTESESLSVNFGTARTYTINHGYDADNRMIETTYPSGKVVDRTYTDRDQVDQIDYDSGMVVDLAYDAGMREIQRQHGNGLFTRRVYGRDDNLVTGIVNETSLNATNRPDASFAYAYDDNKNVVSETTGTTSSPMENYSWTTSGGATPGYDAEDRLTYWTRSSSGSGSIHTQAWPINHGSTGLSLVGDWTTVNVNGVTQSRTHNAVHELLTVNSTGLTHDAKGNLTRDVGDTLDRFTWDFDNRMKAADVNQDGTNDLTFTYDALGRRVSKHDVPGSTHTVYVCMGIGMGQVACEYLANDDPSTTAPQQTYVYGSYVDEALMKVDASSVKLYYHANRQYSVTAMTDASGTVVERYAYSPYGVTTILAPNGSTTRATSSVGNSYMYTGRRLDKEFATTSEDAIYYYRARYYLPPLGRFGSRDLLKYIDGMSVYAGYFAMKCGTDAAGTCLCAVFVPNPPAAGCTRATVGAVTTRSRTGPCIAPHGASFADRCNCLLRRCRSTVTFRCTAMPAGAARPSVWIRIATVTSRCRLFGIGI